MPARRLAFTALFLTCLVSVAGLAWSHMRPYFIVSCLVSVGLTVAFVARSGQHSPTRTHSGYDPCPKCGSGSIERTDDDIRYVPSPGGDMVRHYVRCLKCGDAFESRVGAGGA